MTCLPHTARKYNNWVLNPASDSLSAVVTFKSFRECKFLLSIRSHRKSWMGEWFPDGTLGVMHRFNSIGSAGWNFPFWQQGGGIHPWVVHSFNNHMALVPNGYFFWDVYSVKFIISPGSNSMYPVDILSTGSQSSNYSNKWNASFKLIVLYNFQSILQQLSELCMEGKNNINIPTLKMRRMRQHYLQQPGHGSNLNVHEQGNG